MRINKLILFSYIYTNVLYFHATGHIEQNNSQHSLLPPPATTPTTIWYSSQCESIVIALFTLLHSPNTLRNTTELCIRVRVREHITNFMNTQKKLYQPIITHKDPSQLPFISLSLFGTISYYTFLISSYSVFRFENENSKKNRILFSYNKDKLKLNIYLVCICMYEGIRSYPFAMIL